MIRRAALAVALAGCVGNAPAAAPALDPTAFAASVQPVLAARCASPACHGTDRRRLRVYAQGFFRRDPARLHRDEPLTPEELSANERSAAAFALGAPSPRESLLVAKPLGLVNHLGGQVLTDTDHDCAALVEWVGGAVTP